MILLSDQTNGSVVKEGYHEVDINDHDETDIVNINLETDSLLLLDGATRHAEIHRILMSSEQLEQGRQSLTIGFKSK